MRPAGVWMPHRWTELSATLHSGSSISGHLCASPPCYTTMLTMQTLLTQPGSGRAQNASKRPPDRVISSESICPLPGTWACLLCKRAVAGRCWAPSAWSHKSEKIFRGKSCYQEDCPLYHGKDCLWGDMRTDLVPFQQCWSIKANNKFKRGAFSGLFKIELYLQFSSIVMIIIIRLHSFQGLNDKFVFLHFPPQPWILNQSQGSKHP